MENQAPDASETEIDGASIISNSVLSEVDKEDQNIFYSVVNPAKVNLRLNTIRPLPKGKPIPKRGDLIGSYKYGGKMENVPITAEDVSPPEDEERSISPVHSALDDNNGADDDFIGDDQGEWEQESTEERQDSLLGDDEGIERVDSRNSGEEDPIEIIDEDIAIPARDKIFENRFENVVAGNSPTHSTASNSPRGSTEGDLDASPRERPVKRRNRDEQDEEYEKQEIVLELQSLERQGYKLSREPSMDHSLEYLQRELEKITMTRDREDGTAAISTALKRLAFFTELGNQKLGKFLELDGFSDKFGKDIDNSPAVVDGLYKKYWKRSTSRSPEIQLLFLFIGAIVMTHFGNKFGGMLADKITNENDTHNSRIAGRQKTIPRPEQQPVQPPPQYYPYPPQYVDPYMGNHMYQSVQFGAQPNNYHYQPYNPYQQNPYYYGQAPQQQPQGPIMQQRVLPEQPQNPVETPTPVKQRRTLRGPEQ